MGIKLRTEQLKLVADAPFWKLQSDGVLHSLAHDAAVAHALMRAIDEIKITRMYGRGHLKVVEFIYSRASIILRDDFGIEE